MLAINIYPAAAFSLALTYEGQTTIIKTNSQKPYWGYFQGNHAEDRLKTNKWLFYSFSHRGIIEIDGNDILSIELEENGRKLFHVSDQAKRNHLHTSENRSTVISNYYFTTYPSNPQ